MHRDGRTGAQLLAGLTSGPHRSHGRQNEEHGFGAEIELHPPRVPYQETIRKPAAAHARYRKQSGGRGQFADCRIEIEPRRRGRGKSSSTR